MNKNLTVKTTFFDQLTSENKEDEEFFDMPHPPNTVKEVENDGFTGLIAQTATRGLKRKLIRA
jgi:hypothetical protein